MVLDKFAYDLKFVVGSDVEVSLHSLFNGLWQVLGFHFQFDLEREALEQSQLATEIIGVLVDRNPYLKCVVCVLSIDLI